MPSEAQMEAAAKAGDAEADAERAPTKRVVVRRERAIVLPDGITPEQEAHVIEALRALKLKPLRADTLWSVIGEFEGHSKDAAIKAYAGEPGTPDAKQGAYKAPTASAWSGGLIFEAPPKPLVRARPID